MQAHPIGSHGEYPPMFFEIPEEVRREAGQGLALRQRYGRGGTEVGEERAYQLVGDSHVTLRDIVVMNSYFSRHIVDNLSQMDPPSNGYIAWLLWGGWSGKEWVDLIYSAWKADEDRGEINALLSYGVFDEQELARSNPEQTYVSETPTILQRCVLQVLARDGITKPSRDDLNRAFAICVASLQNAGRLEFGTRELTPYGMEKERAYTPQERIAALVAFEAALASARGGKPRRVARKKSDR